MSAAWSSAATTAPTVSGPISCPPSTSSTSSSTTARASATCAVAPSSVSRLPRSEIEQPSRSRSESSTPSPTPASSAATSFGTSSTSCIALSVGRPGAAPARDGTDAVPRADADGDDERCGCTAVAHWLTTTAVRTLCGRAAGATSASWPARAHERRVERCSARSARRRRSGDARLAASGRAVAVRIGPTARAFHALDARRTPRRHRAQSRLRLALGRARAAALGSGRVARARRLPASRRWATSSSRRNRRPMLARSPVRERSGELLADELADGRAVRAARDAAASRRPSRGRGREATSRRPRRSRRRRSPRAPPPTSGSGMNSSSTSSSNSSASACSSRPGRLERLARLDAASSARAAAPAATRRRRAAAAAPSRPSAGCAQDQAERVAPVLVAGEPRVLQLLLDARDQAHLVNSSRSSRLQPPPSTCQWRWKTVWPPPGPTLTTTR